MFNKVILLGHMTRDPKLTYLPSHTAACDFGLAMNRKWTGSDGQKKEEVCFVDCKCFGKPAEAINKYVKKGQRLHVEGRLTLNQWEKDGVKHSKHIITVESFQFIESNRDNSASGAPVSEDVSM